MATDDPASLALVAKVLELWINAGKPSSRRIQQQIAERHDVTMSHTTINQLLNGTRVPSWSLTELIVRTLDGDVGEVQRLWAATNHRHAAVSAVVSRWEYLQLECAIGEVAQIYQQHDADGWDPLHTIFHDPDRQRIQLVLRRRIA